MTFKGIIFDINGTLSDIQTNEWHDDVYRVISNLLSYQGISLDPDVVKYHYFQIMKEQRAACIDRYPEFDAIGIFRKIIAQHATDFTRGCQPRRSSSSRDFWPKRTVPHHAFGCSPILASRRPFGNCILITISRSFPMVRRPTPSRNCTRSGYSAISTRS